MRLRAVGDPRLDPLFAGLSSKAKFLRTVHFTMLFSQHVTRCILSSSWLYRMSLIPTLVPLNMALEFKRYNESAVGKLSICIYVDVLRKDFCSTGEDRTNLLDIALQVIAADPSEAEHYQTLLNNDEACFDMFVGSNGAGRLIAAMYKSFWKILFLHGDDNTMLLDVLKNLGNSIRTFLTEPEHEASLFLSSELIQDMLHSLPETFVWMPIYGGRQEDYVPPVNRFASHATQQNGGVALGHQLVSFFLQEE